MVGSTEIPVELFEAQVRSWRQPGSLAGTTPIQTQFQVCVCASSLFQYLSV